MRHYRATEIATGAVTEYDADLPLAEHLTAEFTLEDVSDTVPDPEAPPPQYTGSWKITKLAFRNRFTQTEKVTIGIASLDNAAAPMQQRQMAAALRAYEADVAVATFIDLQHPDTRAGVAALESFGLLGAGRAAVILDTIPTDEEFYRGD